MYYITLNRAQNDNEKIYNCQCGAAFATLKELDKHNHEAHQSSTKPYFSFIRLFKIEN